MQVTFNGQPSQKEGNAVPREVMEDVELERLTDIPIGQRTRARNPLKEVTIEELEALLLEDEVYYSEGDDDEAYQQFLKVFSKPSSDPTHISHMDIFECKFALLDTALILHFGIAAW